MKTIPTWTTRCTAQDKQYWTSAALDAMQAEINELRAALAATVVQCGTPEARETMGCRLALVPATANQVRDDILEEAARVADEYHIRNNSSHLADDIAMSIRELKAVK